MQYILLFETAKGNSALRGPYLKVGGEAIDRPDQVIRQNRVKNLAFQKLLVPPVPDDNFVWRFHREADLLWQHFGRQANTAGLATLCCAISYRHAGSMQSVHVCVNVNVTRAADHAQYARSLGQ